MSEDSLMHYGTPRHSGRYPWGSGKDPYQSARTFRKNYEDLKAQGLTEKEIAKAFGMSTTQLRADKSLSRNQIRAADAALAEKLRDKGMSPSEIGRQMGKNESSIRSLLDSQRKENAKITENVADIIRKNVDKKKYVDIGKGTEYMLGVSETKMKTAIKALEKEGYTVNYIKVQQLGTGNYTYIKVLAKPGIEYSEISRNRGNIGLIEEHSNDGGRSFLGLKPIQSISSDRVQINYSETGGDKKDGIIELRRGVEGLDLGGASYAQVRIGVDGTHYLKGMAMYADDLPKGIDVRFNTNKSNTKPFFDVLKPMKRDEKGNIDKDNPFGAVLKIEDKEGASDRIFAQRGYLNIVHEEGDWKKWSSAYNLSSQVLSKQPVTLAKKQLDLQYSLRKGEYEDIMAISNPTVRKRMLLDFADECDSAAVHLQAASLPRQSTHVILPFNTLKDNEIYARNYKQGETVALIRYPHGGKFEIPELKVNNRNQEALKTIGNAQDAVGINYKVANRLSGADFDGDFVLVIPNNEKRIKSEDPIQGLKDFDPKSAYPKYEGMKVMSEKQKQTEMGKVSNLITDMTIRGANRSEIARAVKHSMVVIDAPKHELNYNQSYIDNGIAQLKEKYQGGKNKGASTLISKASSDYRVPQRKIQFTIDPKTGKKIYQETGETYTVKKINKRTGEVKEITKPRLQMSTPMAETDDAFTLSSGTRIENTYATYANSMKALGNKARREAVQTKDLSYSAEANKKYAKEVASLNGKLAIAKKNAPYERKAQAVANVIVESKKKDNPALVENKADLKKVKGQALAEARVRVGAKKQPIRVTDKEWEAIQSGAISKTKLNAIIDNADKESIKKLASPKTKKGMTTSQIARAKSLHSNGYSWAEISELIGVSTSTIQDNIS